MAKKVLRKWNGRGHGKYCKLHMNVAAYSVAEACRILSEACGTPITRTEIKDYYSECWGNSMHSIEPTEPCVYANYPFSKKEPQRVY